MLEPNQHCINKDKGWFITFEGQTNQVKFTWSFTLNPECDGDGFHKFSFGTYKIIVPLVYDYQTGTAINGDYIHAISGEGVAVRLNIRDKRNFASFELALMHEAINYINRHDKEFDQCLEPLTMQEAAQ